MKSRCKFFICLSIILCGCNFFHYQLPLENVNILVDKNANFTNAVALDLVIVCDEKLNEDISKLSAVQYFEKKQDIVLSNQDSILIWHWEVVPGQQLRNLPITFNEFDPVGGYIFASYNNKSANRIKIPRSKEIKIILKKQNYQVLAVKESIED